MSTSDIAVIGDRDSILCFRAIGVDVLPVADDDEARSRFQEALESQYSIIFITEQFAVGLEDKIYETVSHPLPSVVLIPNNRGSLGIGAQKVREIVKKAVGADIFRE